MMDELDELILKELRKDARQSYRKIAGNLKVATGTIQNRIQKMEKDKLIKGYRVDIDYQKLGYNISAIIAICIDRFKIKEVEEKLKKNPHIFGVYTVTGEYDLFLSVSFKTMTQLNEFITDELKDSAIIKSVTFMILGTEKEEHTFLTG